MEGPDCALDGLDLAILAHAATHPGQPLDPPLRQPRRVAALRQKRLLDSHRRGARWVHWAAPFGNAAAALLEARPSLARELSSPKHVAILAALHALQRPKLEATRQDLIWLTGASPNTFRRAFLALRNANVILEPEGHIILNPRLTALHAFLAAFEAECALPPAGLRPATTLHSAGLETAWTTSAPDHVGLQRVAGQEAFQAIVQPQAIYFRGPRKLDRWDHAFLFLLSDARRFDSGIEASARLKASVMALMNPKLALNQRFEWRARFYGLESFAADARTVLTTPHAFREFVDEMRNRFHTPEGWLDAKS